MSLSKRLFWGPVTTQFVEDAILENESLVLIDAVKNRIGALLENVFYRDATKIADAVAYRIGQLCIDMRSRKIDIDNFTLAISGLRRSVITAIQMRTVLGFSESVSEHVVYLLDVVHGVAQEALAADEKTIGSSPENETISHVDTSVATPLVISQAETGGANVSSGLSMGEEGQDSTDDVDDLGFDIPDEQTISVGTPGQKESGSYTRRSHFAHDPEGDGREKVSQHMLNHVVLPREVQMSLARTVRAGVLASQQLKMIKILQEGNKKPECADFYMIALLFDIDFEKMILEKMDQESEQNEGETLVEFLEQQVEHESDAFKKSIYEVFISHVRECQEDFHKNKVDITVIWSEMSKKGAQIKQNTDLDKRIKEGDEAREKLITHNLRFVAQQAEKYEHVSSGGMDFKDILQEGCIGLMKAVDRFDPDRGAALITYARWWIHQKIRDALAKKLRNIRIPTGVMGSIYKIHSVIKKFRQANDRDPDHEEISEMTGISLKRVKNLLKVSLGTVSLDAPMSDDSQSFVEVTADERATNPFEAASNNNMLGQLDGLLSALDERERNIIDARFGLAGQKPMTLEEVGQTFGVTRERIRQLQNIALKKLREALGKREDVGQKGLPQFRGIVKRNVYTNIGTSLPGKSKKGSSIGIQPAKEAISDRAQTNIHTNASVDIGESVPSADLISDAEIGVSELGLQEPEQENIRDRAELVEEGGYDQLSEGNSPGLYEEDVAAELSAQASESISDEELWEKIVQRDEAALREIMHRYSVLLNAVIRRILHDSGACEEVAQDAWMQFWNKASNYDPKKGKLLGWLVTLFKRNAIDKIRRMDAYQRAVDRLEKSGEYRLGGNHSDSGGTSSDMTGNEINHAIDEALKLIPMAQRDTIVQRFLQGMSQRETGFELHAPLGTIKTREELGLKKLKWHLRHLGKERMN